MENVTDELPELSNSSRGEIVFDGQQLSSQTIEASMAYKIREPEEDFLRGDSYPGRSLFERR